MRPLQVQLTIYSYAAAHTGCTMRNFGVHVLCWPLDERLMPPLTQIDTSCRLSQQVESLSM